MSKVSGTRFTHTPPRPSTAPHAELERQAVEAFQGIRAELDNIHRTLEDHRQLQRTIVDALLRLHPPSRWARFKAWRLRNVYASTPTKDDGTLKFDASPGDGY